MTNEIIAPGQEQAPAAEEPLVAIRRYTAGLHERLEASVDLDARLSSRQSYAAFLRQYLRLYLALESRLSDLSGRPASIASRLYRPKVNLLLRDLHFLAPALSAVQPADPAIFPDLRDSSALFGALYVVEGSSLGGRFIAKRAEQQLQVTAACGAAFFSGDGAATGSNWRDFTAALNREVTNPDGAAEAAYTTFLAFESCLTSQAEAP